ncbi:VanZ family protein [Dethiobacter alkaliphilus]|nr:VanZ family protein [Dethiobacter alkaliphilus]
MGERRIATVSWLAVFLWMGLIFYLSHQPGEASAALSSGVTDVIFRTVVAVFNIDVAPGAGDGMFHFWVRKSAHAFLYFVLAVLVIHALGRSGVVGRKAYLIAFLFCVFYAVTDEVHQLYVPGRSGEIGDVVIDSVGAAAGLVVFSLGNNLRRYVLKARE